jgi:DNA-binding PucR family transcriptional regulator
MGPMVTDLLAAAGSARAATAGLRAAPGWPGAPRPVVADDLLPERALSGDGHARHRLVIDVYAPVATDDTLLHTLEAYLEHGASIEGSARSLFVHANTIRYRLRRIEEMTGLSPAHPRDAYTLRVALTLGRLRAPDS